jgi:aryl-alcohol dehydrogenase-like predicted oxidoreductase
MEMKMHTPSSLRDYRLLGRSGLRVSPLCLGAMTFGDNWGGGADEGVSRRIFDTYTDMGGNFIDTANQYSKGMSEELVGKFAKEKRDSLVIATKYSLSTQQGDPNSSGNHRKNMVQAVEKSLKRLQMDCIDLFYLHMWDFTTPVEEILRALDDLTRAGKIIYAGVSDIPAWQASRMQAIADLRGWTPIVALEVEYSLIERTVERDLIPMAQEMGMGVVGWAPLGSGVLTGKYSMKDLPAEEEGKSIPTGSRHSVAIATGALTRRGLAIADEVKAVAAEIGASPAQTALAWLLSNPSVTAPIIGARTVAQLEDNLKALEVRLSESHIERLNAASQIEPGFPHGLLAGPTADALLFPGLKRIRRQ